MIRPVLLLFPVLLSACAQLPEIELANGESSARVTVSDWLLPLLRDTESTQLLMCDVETPREACNSERKGLDAAGVGGIFIPLRVSLPVVTIKASRASLQVAINGIDAACTTGTVNTNVNRAFVEISNVYCNWLVIGNVSSNLKLSFDWDDPASRTFGGRYTIRFIGTGNGSGSGLYSAKVTS